MSGRYMYWKRVYWSKMRKAIAIYILIDYDSLYDYSEMVKDRFWGMIRFKRILHKIGRKGGIYGNSL